MIKKFPVLLVGSTIPTSLENIYKRAFNKNGFKHVDILSTDIDRPKNRILNRIFPQIIERWAGKKLINHLSNSNKKYHWIIVFKGMEFNLKTLQLCKKLSPNALWININPDDPYNEVSRGASNLNVKECIRFFDYYCMWSKTIAKRLKNDGCSRVLYLPFAYDEDFHLRPDKISVSQPEFIAFVGTWDKPRELLLSELGDFNVKIFGNGWSRASKDFPLKNNVSSEAIFGNDLSTIISSAVVALNPMRSQNIGSHNMRSFEIPAAGGLMLTTRSSEQEELFPDSQASFMYSDIDELKQKLQYIISNREEALRVRECGMKLVSNHTYTSRVQYLLETIK